MRAGKRAQLPATKARASVVRMKRFPVPVPFTVLFTVLLATLAGCAMPNLRGTPDAPTEPAPIVTENPGDEVLRPLVRPLAGAAPTPAPPAPAPDGFLGETLAGLGAPTEWGLWLATGLVATPTPGRIETASGGALEVELRPTGAAPSAGSQISLQAMQALGLPLSQLATLRVYAR